ncbi:MULTISPECIES: FAD-binding oxidoreductase [unclassified Corynebacterium]|uniref:FAD-binding oxidoreductase n=1 Tax=unclassified Corynebacterium TaxID=2624378 RepID=UPI0029C9D346|nr:MULTISPECIES: FAD-binding oxidoreductase [unclassified Corynebacterium]WPF66345.1 FAD-binding oxidoreductase [Corynebacterium sp. 22KM0430]WPF68835.1 FAD-binding oxidoreductase [Corynebacterium sp. 21KM1197]
MSHNLWGTPEEAKPLSGSVRKLVSTVLGANADEVNRIPAAEIQLSEVRLSEEDLGALRGIVGKQYVSTEHEQRMRRARGKSYPDLLDWRSGRVIDAPDAVVVPGTEEEVEQLLRWCTEQRVAVVPFGGGTSVVGGVAPKKGQLRAVISLDLVRFDELEDVDTVSMEATLGAGLSGPHAELKLAQHGLQIGHFPQSFPYATIGGYAVTRSSGQNSAGYGRFDEMVRELTVVTPVGITRVGYQAPASAAGPDLRQLFMGSEGTLGVITRVRLRVHPIPEVKRYEAFSFPSFAAGADAMREVTQTGTGPTVLRLSDEIESSINLSSTDKIGDSDDADSGCLLLTMYEGTPEHAEARHEETRDLLLSLGGVSRGEGPVRQWERGRFGAPVLRDGLLDQGAVCETFETATEWSNVEKVKQAVTEAVGTSLAESGSSAIIMCHISHVYHGGCSLYFTIIAGQRGDDPAAQWWKAKEAACQAMVDNGATITHHHAVGTDHRPWVHKDLGELGSTILASVKKTLDPAGILNPDKLF